jgi:glycosyltransferase involved in cell wall biosynthesis
VSTNALAQIVSLRSTPLFKMTVPSKLFFCFATGSPILAGLEGDAAELADASGGALLFDSENPHSLVGAVECLLAKPVAERSTMRANLRDFYLKRFQRDHLLDAYRAVFSQCLAPADMESVNGVASPSASSKAHIRPHP